MGGATSSVQWPHSIREINDLSWNEKQAIYRTLLPEWIFDRFGVERHTHTIESRRVIHFRCPVGSSAVEVSIYHSPQASDPVLYLHMGDTFNSQLAVLMVIVSDPDSPRFGIDVDSCGQITQLGTMGRNVPEEIRAMRAGLVPGQIRRGMRGFRTALPGFECFVSRMGHGLFFIEPLFYHNAITFERYGFAYSHGLSLMRDIHQRFLPGGDLFSRLDHTTPFRVPDAWRTISGRSWAIHDGVLGKPFDGVRMYKRVGQHAGLDTFPDAQW
jgi:hypothetical protein